MNRGNIALKTSSIIFVQSLTDKAICHKLLVFSYKILHVFISSQKPCVS